MWGRSKGRRKPEDPERMLEFGEGVQFKSVLEGPKNAGNVLVSTIPKYDPQTSDINVMGEIGRNAESRVYPKCEARIYQIIKTLGKTAWWNVRRATLEAGKVEYVNPKSIRK